MRVQRCHIIILSGLVVCLARTGGESSVVEVSEPASGILTEPEAHAETGHGEHHPVHHAERVDENVAGHVDHGASPQHKGINGHCPGNQSANSVAVGLMASVILIPVALYMAMTEAAGGAVSCLTFRMLDLTTSIFLAVLWFSASAEVLDHAYFKKAFPQSEEVFALLQVFLLYALTMLVAYKFRDNKYYLVTFCGCAGHYIAFAAIKWAGESQHVAGQWAGKEYSIPASFGFCLVVLAVYLVMTLICFFTWRRYIKNAELHEAVEELEFDIIGLVLSFAIMQALRHALTGHYPSQAHMFLQQSSAIAGHGLSTFHSSGSTDCVTLDHEHKHTAVQRAFMLMWSVLLTIVACATLSPMEELKERSGYWMHKAVHTTQVVLVMCVAWGYLLWGEWQFYETYFHGDEMFGKMVFAVIATSVSLAMLTALAFSANERLSKVWGYTNLCVMAMSLVTAWSWEHCFHTAIEVVATQYEVGYGGLVPKIIIALCIPLAILPGYIIFIKPLVVSKAEKLQPEEKESLTAHLQEVLYHSLSAEGVEDVEHEPPADDKS